MPLDFNEPSEDDNVERPAPKAMRKSFDKRRGPSAVRALLALRSQAGWQRNASPAPPPVWGLATLDPDLDSARLGIRAARRKSGSDGRTRNACDRMSRCWGR